MSKVITIDPASYSSGWCLHVDGDYSASGTIAVTGEDYFERLWKLREGYRGILNFVETDEVEVHIEQMPSHTVSWMVIGSVAVIGECFKDKGYRVYQDVPVSSWKKAVGWPALTTTEKKRNFGRNREFFSEKFRGTVLEKYVGEVESLDALSSIGMGIYWQEKGK